MLQLTLTDGRMVLVDPAHIAAIEPEAGVTLIFQTGDTNPWDVVETASDVARLKAAWEQRFNASELRGSLPIAVAFDPEGSDGRGAIMFKCCAITQALREEREAARALSRRRFLGFGRR